MVPGAPTSGPALIRFAEESLAPENGSATRSGTETLEVFEGSRTESLSAQRGAWLADGILVRALVRSRLAPRACANGGFRCGKNRGPGERMIVRTGVGRGPRNHSLERHGAPRGRPPTASRPFGTTPAIGTHRSGGPVDFKQHRNVTGR